MSISKEKIWEKRKRFEMQKARDEAKSKALRMRIRKAGLRLANIAKQEEAQKKMILGTFFLNKMKTDPAFSKSLESELATSTLGEYEKSLFVISQEAVTK